MEEVGREREGPKLLLNQGPSEPCYATGFDTLLPVITSYSEVVVPVSYRLSKR